MYTCIFNYFNTCTSHQTLTRPSYTRSKRVKCRRTRNCPISYASHKKVTSLGQFIVENITHTTNFEPAKRTRGCAGWFNVTAMVAFTHIQHDVYICIDRYQRRTLYNGESALCAAALLRTSSRKRPRLLWLGGGGVCNFQQQHTTQPPCIVT